MKPAIRQRFFQIGMVILIQAGALFGSAWSWRWWNAWVYLGIYLVYLGFNAAVLLRSHPDLIEERSRTRPDAKGWDKRISLITTVGFIGVLIIAGLDWRFGWTGTIRVELQVAAFILLGTSYPLFTWAMLSNKFFSTLVRIQTERGHTVQTGGPYRFIRHPGYLSLLLSTILLPFALGSLWACLPTLLLVFNLIIRTMLEDRTLQNELEGYQEYANRVRYRLIPGVW